MSEQQLIRPFWFMGRSYTGKEKLISALAAHWKEGEEALFSGKLSAYFKTIDRTLYNRAVNAEKACMRDPPTADFIFWDWIYSQGTEKELFWKSRNYGDLAQVLRLLYEGSDPEFNRLLMRLMGEKLFHVYVKSAGMSEQVQEDVRYVEEPLSKEASGDRTGKTRLLLYTILTQRRQSIFDAKSFSDIPSSATYLQEFADGVKKMGLKKMKSKKPGTD